MTLLHDVSAISKVCEAIENKDGKSVHTVDVRWVQCDLCDHWGGGKVRGASLRGGKMRGMVRGRL